MKTLNNTVSTAVSIGGLDLFAQDAGYSKTASLGDGLSLARGPGASVVVSGDVNKTVPLLRTD